MFIFKMRSSETKEAAIIRLYKIFVSIDIKYNGFDFDFNMNLLTSFNQLQYIGGILLTDFFIKY